MKKRFLFASDIHLCHVDWYDIPTEQRMQSFVDNICAEYEKNPFEALFLLGDYSLDHWKWGIKGSWVTERKSNTERFVKEYLCQLTKLGFEIRMIPGNHEQYGEALWKKITGHSRQEFYLSEDLLFVLLDTYAGELDPDFHSDGKYTGVDMQYLKKLLVTTPAKRVILCAHYLEAWNETEEFRALLREDKRIQCILTGHTHQSEIWRMEEVYGSIPQLFTGQYHFSALKDPSESMWGYREMIFTDDGWESRYITPENRFFWEEKEILHPYGTQDEIILPYRK